MSWNETFKDEDEGAFQRSATVILEAVRQVGQDQTLLLLLIIWALRTYKHTAYANVIKWNANKAVKQAQFPHKSSSVSLRMRTNSTNLYRCCLLNLVLLSCVSRHHSFLWTLAVVAFYEKITDTDCYYNETLGTCGWSPFSGTHRNEKYFVQRVYFIDVLSLSGKNKPVDRVLHEKQLGREPAEWRLPSR